MKEDWTKKADWFQQNNLVYLGLIGIGVVIVQPFLTAQPLDLSAEICVVAFSLAIPLLSILVMLTHLQASHHNPLSSFTQGVAKAVGLASASVGLVAAFWHVLWIAGVVVLVSGIAGFALYITYYRRLERNEGIKPR
jgi:hypothetical protein